MSAILLSFLLFGAAPAEVKTSQTPTTRLYVETTPAGATIKVDGKLQGTTPRTIVVAPGAGKLTIDVELDGHASKRQEVTIQGGRVTRIQLNLAPQAGSRTAVSAVGPSGSGIMPSLGTSGVVVPPRPNRPSTSRNVPARMYAVPTGNVDTLVKFIQTVSEYKPKTPEEDLCFRVHFRSAIGRAAEEILKLDKDPNSEASQAAKFVLLANRVYALAQGDPQQQEKTIADVKAYLGEQVKKGQVETSARLALLLGGTLEQMGQYQRAADTLQGLADLTVKNAGANLSAVTSEIRQTIDRLASTARQFPHQEQKLPLPPKGRLIPLDLSKQANMDTVTFDSPPGGGMGELSHGENTFGGVKFYVGPKAIQLACNTVRSRPEKVEGIPVGRRIATFYVLHAGQIGGTDNVRAAEYRLRYEDGSTTTFPVVYGEDLCNWWNVPNSPPATRGAVVWTGNNFNNTYRGYSIRLYLGTWENPCPEKKVVSLDYVSTMTQCAPFCVAITVEEPAGTAVSPVPGAPMPAMYEVPEGGVAELVKFIQALSEYKPKTPEEDLPYRVYFRRAIGEAAEKILKLDKDPNSEASQAARFVLLANRVYALAQGDPQQQEKTLADVRAYLREQFEKGQGEAAGSLAVSVGKTLEQMGEYQRAADALRGFAEGTAKSGDASLSRATAELTRTAERLAASAKEFPREDKKLVLPPQGRLFPVDLKGKTNRNANTISINRAFAGNGLAELPRGEHSFGGVKFWIGDEVIHLGSSGIQTAPPEVKGIPVDRKIVRLYVLHGGQKGDQGGLPRSGTRVGEYRLRYDDGTSATFPIIYGQDYRDWWYGGDHFPTTRGKVVWTGGNFRTAQAFASLRLYLSAWENPHPDKKITSLDYISALEPDSAPFCVAMTVEEEP